MNQFINFIGAGAIATALHYSVLLILVEIFGFNVVLSSGIGALVGGITSYILNRRFTFHSNLPHSKTLPKFFVVAGFAVLLNIALMQLFTVTFSTPYLFAQILTTGLLIVVTFGLNKLWSFKENRPKDETRAQDL